METRTLSILICSSNQETMQQMARMLDDEGVNVQTSNRPIDHLCFSQQKWDLLLVDLDGLNSFLRSLLPPIFRKFPNLPKIGISMGPTIEDNAQARGYNLELDAYLSEMPHPEELIALIPQVSEEYQCDEDTLRELGWSPVLNINLEKTSFAI